MLVKAISAASSSGFLFNTANSKYTSTTVKLKRRKEGISYSQNMTILDPNPRPNPICIGRDIPS